MPKDFKRISLIFLCIGFFSFFLVAPRIAKASFSVSGEIIVTDVGHNSCYVVWEADIDKAVASYEASVIVYEDQTGTEVSGYNSQELRMYDNGVMAVKVTNIPEQPSGGYTPTTYYFRIMVIEDGDTGNPHYYPALSETDLTNFCFTTQIQEEGASPSNPSVSFKVYKSDELGNQVTLSATDGVFVCLDVAGASYPVFGGGVPGGASSGFAILESGSPFSEVAAVELGAGGLRDAGNKGYLTISGGETMTVRCLGASLGNASATISSFNVDQTNCQAEFEAAGDCETNFIEVKLNVIQIAQNMSPQIDPFQYGGDVRLIGTKYGLKEGQSFILNVHGDDPDEGESIQSWTLTGDVPSGMEKNIITDPTDIEITWTPGAGDVEQEYTVVVNAINDKTGSRSFTVFVTDGVPDPPASVVITTTAPQTDDDLSCTITGGSDPLGDPITYDFRWYNDLNGTEDTGSTKNTVITLDHTVTDTAKGETWRCEVTVTDDAPYNDGTSGPTLSEGVEILNTSPDGTPGVTITSSDTTPPTTVSDLTAVVDISGCTDDDPIDNGNLFYEEDKWWKKAPGAGSFSVTGFSALTLSHDDTEKGETWIYKATVTDGYDPGNTGTSNELLIQNTPPDATGMTAAIALVGNDIVCTVSGASDADEDNLDYHYKWVGEKPSVADKIVQRWVSSASDTLSASELSKLETWHCEIIGVGDGEVEITTLVRNDSGEDVYIDNTSPVWDTNKYPTISPTGTAYNDATLTCTVDADAATDNDGDPITYSYAWYNDSGAVNLGDANTLDPSVVGLLVQDAEYYCEVTACDNGSPNACIDYNTNSVLIGNRAPTITVWKGSAVIADGGTVQVTETQELALTIISDDADNNTLSSLDADANIPTGAVIQIVGANEAAFTWTPAQGKAGTYDVVFKVQETDGPDSLEITHSVQIKVTYPSKVIDNFEFQSEPDPNWYLPTNPEEDLEKRSDHGWSVLTGSGNIYRKSYENDPDNHYLEMVSSESKPLHYITTLWLDPNKTKDFYEVRCDIDTNSPYSFEAYVHVVDTVSGAEKDYFLRYIPEDPTSGNEFKVDGMYINYYIGSEFIDPNGCSLQRNMEDDIHDAIAAKGKQYQSHYDYVWGFILRGGIDKFDNLEVVYGERDTDPPNPVDAENMTAVGIDGAVVLTWTDPNQENDLLGYKIEWEKDGEKVDEEEVYVFDEGISGEVKSHTIILDNLPVNEFYSFTIKSFDEEKAPNYSAASEAKDARPHEDITPPVMSSCVLDAEAPETMGETIDLTWNDPNDPEVSYFVLYMDGNNPIATVVDVNKTVYSHLVTGLVNGTDYRFKIKGFNADGYGAFGSNEPIGTPRAPQVLVFDIFDYAVDGDDPDQHGWSILQGSGNMDAVYEDGNSYMKVTTNYTTKTNFIVTKFVDNPGDYTNPELHFDLKGVAGEFRIDLYVSDDAGNKYFLSYCGAAVDSTPANPKDGMYITHNIGCDGTWRHVQRNLNDDIQDGVSGVFGNFIGMVIRGEVCIDDVIFKEAVSEVTNLIARPGDEEVELSWICPDPNIVDEFTLSVDGGTYSINHTYRIAGTNEYVYNTDTDGGLVLNNGTEYTFKVMQVINSVPSAGVEVKATPLAFTHQDGCSSTASWADGGNLGDVYTEHDDDILSEVIVIDPNANAVNSYLVDHDINQSGDNVTLRIKAESGFSLWIKFSDNNNAERNLVYFSGGNANTVDNIGDWDYWFYRYLGPSYTDGRWHTLTLDLNSDLENLKNLNFTVMGISSVSIGGEVRVDDLSVY